MVGIMSLETKALRQQYRVKAHIIGSNAIKLVDEFFKSGIEDMVEYPICGSWVKCKHYKWTLTDLDRALYEMQKQNLGKAERFVMTFLEDEFINSHDAFRKAINSGEKWKGLKS